MKDWKDKFVLIFVTVALVFFFILVLRAMERGETKIEDVLEPHETFTESLQR